MKVATLRLSGSKIKVGFLSEDNPANDSVWFKTDEQPEPIYMSFQEAKLLICALQTAIAEGTQK